MNDSVRHCWLPYWLKLGDYDVPEDDPGKLKECLTKLGINSRTWKLYAEYGDGLFRPLANGLLSSDRPEQSLSNALAYLRLLNGCEVDIAPPQELAAALAQCNLPGNSIAALPVAVFRGAWRALVQAGYRGTTGRTFVNSEFIPILRWFFARGLACQFDNNRSKASWTWLRRHWVDEQARRALPAGPVEWAAPLRSAQVGNLRFFPLQSIAALQDEGRLMRHCVADLVECCRKGCVQVFSVRDARTLDRVATLALRSRAGAWVIADLKADRNACPDEKVARAALGLLSCVEECSTAPMESDDGCDECTLRAWAARRCNIHAGPISSTRLTMVASLLDVGR